MIFHGILIGSHEIGPSRFWCLKRFKQICHIINLMQHVRGGFLLDPMKHVLIDFWCLKRFKQKCNIINLMHHIDGVWFVWHKLKTTNIAFQIIVIFGQNKNYYKMFHVTSIGLKLQALDLFTTSSTNRTYVHWDVFLCWTKDHYF